MAKSRRIRLTAILAFIAGIISLVLGLYVSWKFSVFFLILPGTIVGSAIVISLVLHSLLRLRIRIEKEEMLLMWGLILILIAIGIVVATFVIVQFNATPQMAQLTVLAIAILGYVSFIVAKQKRYYLFAVIIEAACIYITPSIFKDLWLYSIFNILLLAVITAILTILMKILTKHCGKSVNFISLLKEFAIDPLSNALSLSVFATPFVSILVSTLVISNRIPLASFDTAIRSGLVLVGTFLAAAVTAVKLYRECYAAKIVVIVIAILTIAPLIYTLGILHGLSFTIKDLNDLEPILTASFMFVALFVHAPMMCPLSNKDVCAKFG